jgi:pimeloyl-ACP methyl ester carboxylesterase
LKYLALFFLILLAAWTWYQASQQTQQVSRWPVIQANDQVGLRAVDCWFGDVGGLAPVECYDMQVRERHGAADSRFITFPVMVFRSKVATNLQSPLLHLGAGGPGAPMYLDDHNVLVDAVRGLAKASLNQGRDLILIDPRGTGLARPLLSCIAFVDGERQRLRQSLTVPEIIASNVKDYSACIDSFIEDGVDLASYNSFAVAKDIEALRQVAGIERWVLFGVSYAANYALTIADEYPATVESMVLDSSYVSRIGFHENYIEEITRPYQMLFDYCIYDPDCRQPIANLEERFWALYSGLNKHPIPLELENVDNSDRFPMLLDGERFLSAIMEGIYDVQIFRDLPHIITELENGKSYSLTPYLWLHVDYMLNPYWGDVSDMAHYCYEQKPQIDFARIREQFDRLPSGYIRDNAPLMLDWPDHCEQMQIHEAAPKLVPSQRLAMPTLFLHGNLDSVTPLSSVRKILHYFKRAQLLTFDLGHSVLTSSYCARNSMALFIADPEISRQRLLCS